MDGDGEPLWATWESSVFHQIMMKWDRLLVFSLLLPSCPVADQLLYKYFTELHIQRQGSQGPAAFVRMFGKGYPVALLAVYALCLSLNERSLDFGQSCQWLIETHGTSCWFPCRLAHSASVQQFLKLFCASQSQSYIVLILQVVDSIACLLHM